MKKSILFLLFIVSLSFMEDITASYIVKKKRRSFTIKSSERVRRSAVVMDEDFLMNLGVVPTPPPGPRPPTPVPPREDIDVAFNSSSKGKYNILVAFGKLFSCSCCNNHDEKQ